MKVFLSENQTLRTRACGEIECRLRKLPVARLAVAVLAVIFSEFACVGSFFAPIRGAKGSPTMSTADLSCSSFVCPAAPSETAPPRLLSPANPQAFALVEIQCEPDWQWCPRGDRSIPPLVVANLPYDLAAEFVSRFNESKFSLTKNKWAMVVCAPKWKAYGVLSVQCLEANRPEPGQIPRTLGAEYFTNREKACAIRNQLNSAILHVCRQPKVWNVIVCTTPIVPPVVPVDTSTAPEDAKPAIVATEGGAA